MAEQLCTLLLVAADAAVLQLGQDLDQHFPEGGHDKGRVEVAEAGYDTHGKFPDSKQLQRKKKRIMNHSNDTGITCSASELQLAPLLKRREEEKYIIVALDITLQTGVKGTHNPMH